MATSLPTSQLPAAESALTCGVCLSDFDAGFRRPLLLPKCGHTFCRLCIKDLAARGDISCPSCRYKYSEVEPDNLPINFNIQCLSSSTKVFPTISKIEDPGSLCVDHKVRLAFWCSSCEVAACGECLYDRHPRPSHTICRIEEVVEQVKERAQRLARESCGDVVVRLGESVKRTLRDVSDLQEAAHLLQETARIYRSAQVADSLPSITSVFESAKTVKQKVGALEHSEEGGYTMPIEAIVSSRPAVLALSESGGLAQVKVERKGIHIYSLRPTSTAYSVAIKLTVLMSCVKKESPLVFLDLKAGERRLGRVYITLVGTMRRSQQFIALCLGNLGHSYRGTRFDGISEKGQPGEYLRGGDYQGRGGLGGEALMDNLEWGGQWAKPKAAGQVCGVGGEEGKKFGSLFAICLRDNPEDTFRVPFGEVTEGLEVLEIASRHEPFRVVHISDCGLVIPL
ncbi:tripartite motif-containing protein 75-like [Homarus americanus]|uniref:tripartite motif-containing protein 75-like n=1 Tax=Homarus americanus TaxID=6706 RepID=UPI001C47B255|nr:tripartite motif-containing protein 75-like [Homarus americanus]